MGKKKGISYKHVENALMKYDKHVSDYTKAIESLKQKAKNAKKRADSALKKNNMLEADSAYNEHQFYLKEVKKVEGMLDKAEKKISRMGERVAKRDRTEF